MSSVINQHHLKGLLNLSKIITVERGYVIGAKLGQLKGTTQYVNDNNNQEGLHDSKNTYP